MGIPIKGCLAVLGGFLINLMMGSFYTFGNVMPYLASYMRERSNITVTYSDFATVNMVFGVVNGLSLAGAPLILIPLIGDRMVALLGSFFYCLGVFLTQYSINHSLTYVIVTYGAIQSLGNMALIPTYVIPMRWFPNRKGTVMGLVVSGYGMAALVMSPIQLLITNPNNVPPSEFPGIDDRYFTDPDVIDRVPSLLLYLSLIYACVLIIAILSLNQPPREDANGDSSVYKKSWADLKILLHDYKIKVFNRRQFYMLFFTRMSFTLVTFSISTYYKSLALTFIDDDHYITTYIGTVSGILQLFGRLGYGFFLDVLPYQLVLCFQTGILAIMVGTLYSTISLGKVAFTVSIWVIYMTFPGIFAILPARSSEVFGDVYAGVVVGCVALSDLLTTGTIQVVGKALLQGFLITLFFPKTPDDVRKLERLKNCCSKNQENSRKEYIDMD